MSDTIVITSIYKEFWGTDHFLKSCEHSGFDVHNAFKGNKFTGNGDVIRMIYNALKELKGLYKYAVYSDGADSLIVNHFTPPDDYILYSTEKAIWPPTKEMEYMWADYYYGLEEKSPWKYLNGGGYCGRIDLLIKFFENYGLSDLKGDVNGQREQAIAYVKAHNDGFNIKLDTKCEIFQTTAFAEPDEFLMDGIGFYNPKTDTHPSVLHGNGRTDMTSLYNYYKFA